MSKNIASLFVVDDCIYVTRAPRGTGRDEKNGPMGRDHFFKIFHPMGWDHSLKCFRPMGRDHSLKCFRPMGRDDF
jgi:hypothetical protein